jgi:hypothetical protein
MTVHALHIFDRKGKTLFTKRYTNSKSTPAQDAEQLSEQRKLIFGMLFSLRELMGSLTPEGETPGKLDAAAAAAMIILSQHIYLHLLVTAQHCTR